MSGENTGRQKSERIATNLGLKERGKDSFIQLCDKGCNPEFLAEYLPFIVPKTRITVRPKNAKRKPYKISLRSLDSFDDALRGFEKHDLEAMQEQLLKTAKQIEKLNKTKLVKYTDDKEYDTDIYKIPYFLVYYSKIFIPLLLKKYESIGEKQSPQYTEYLNRILDHIQRSTGRINYKLICDVLNEIGVDEDESSLKQWRYRNKPKSSQTDNT